MRVRAMICLFVGLVFGVHSTVTAQHEITIDLGRGPVPVYIPENYDPDEPTPLVMLLHGYGSDGETQDRYMRFKALADEFNYIYTYPDGTRDLVGSRFWNATDACCDFFFTRVDDSGYLAAIIDEIKTLGNIDDRRVYLIGHSNGGYMAHRMACDHAETVAAIASLAGSSWNNFNRCAPSEPVHTLRIHGTNDDTIFYDGGFIFAPYPGAIDLSRQWRDFNACSETVIVDPNRLDLDYFVPGRETVVARADDACLPGGSSELWTMQGSGHVPFLSLNFNRRVIEYLYAHPKPE